MKVVFTVFAVINVLLLSAQVSTAIYDFEGLTVGPIHGQDNWNVKSSHSTVNNGNVCPPAVGTELPPAVAPTTTAGLYVGSQALANPNFDFASQHSIVSRVNDVNWSLPDFSSSEYIVLEWDFNGNYWGKAFHLCADMNMDNDFSSNCSAFDANEKSIGLNVTTNTVLLYNASGVQVATAPRPSEWVRFRIFIDVNAGNGSGRINVCYRELGSSGNWVSIPTMQNINAGLSALNQTNPDNWNGMAYEQEAGGTGYMDNISSSSIYYEIDNATFCQGQPVTIGQALPGATYVWSTGATTATIDVSTSGLFYVDVTLDDCITFREFVTVSQEVVLNTMSDVEIFCEDYILPVISGTNLSGNQAYYSGPNGTGTQYLPGDVISGQMTLYIYDDNGSCTDQEIFNVNLNTVDLGPDTLICSGSQLLLDAGAGYDSYQWSTGATTQTITVSTAGTYSVAAGELGQNIITNGDFSLGNTGFSTDYTLGVSGSWGPLSNAGTFAVNTSPSNVHNNFSNCGDHTTGAGNMLIVNGSGNLNTNIWCQTVNVVPNTQYLFSAWVMNALNDVNVANLQFFVNGVQIGAIFSSNPIGCIWEQYNDTWNSGMSTTANICIVNQNTTTSGNDFAIDDIYFAPVCNQTDEIVVTVDPITVNAGVDISFCENELIPLLATSNDPNATFQWNSGQNTAGFQPATSGTYTITATAQSGCQVTDNVVVSVTAMPWTIDDIFVQDAECDLNNGIVSVITGGTFNVPPLYTWSGPGANNPNQINASVWENLSPGWYYITINSAGCIRTDSAEVSITNPPVAIINATPTAGNAPLDVTLSNNSLNASDYTWNFGNGNGTSDNTGQSYNQVYSQEGTYQVMLIASANGNCPDTAYATIIVTEPIPDSEVIIPNVFTPNGDGANDFFTFEMFNVMELDVVIINRWGNVMYTSNDVNFVWDGTVAGGMAEEGVYFYKYTSIGFNGDERKGQGFVQLEL